MKNLALPLFIVVFSSAAAIAQSSTDEAKVSSIRDVYRKVNEKIAEMEMAPDVSSIFVSELVVNKNNSPYPAVGIYNSTVRFYYTYGDREKDPYPVRLLKVMVTTRRSSETELSEFLYSQNGELIFAFTKNGKAETRVYFSANKVIRSLKGGDPVSISRTEAYEFWISAKRLNAIFMNSIEK